MGGLFERKSNRRATFATCWDVSLLSIFPVHALYRSGFLSQSLPTRVVWVPGVDGTWQGGGQAAQLQVQNANYTNDPILFLFMAE